MSDCEDVHYGSRPDNIIQYGHHISLKHNMSGRYLTSEGGNHYETGSGQQVVFAGGWEAIPEATFIVMPDIGVEIDGEVDVNFGDVVRLKHLTSRANLHSHPDVPSPVTEVQQEVSCFGDDFNSDENDAWIVEQWTCDDEENEEFDPEDPTWYVNRSFSLRHRATGMTLHSHEYAMNEDQNEVSCYGGDMDENDRWRVAF